MHRITATSPSRRNSRRPSLRPKLIGASIVAAIALITFAGPASAHVEAEGDTAATGITTVTFSFSHGCGESPTTSLKIELPAGTTEVKAQDSTGFTAVVTADTLTWSGGSIPSSTPGKFVADMRIVGNAGDTIFLPTVQGCVVGEEDWIEKTEDPEADNAAPRITLTQTVAPASSTTSTTAAAGSSTSTTKATSTTEAATGTTTEPGLIDDSSDSDSSLPLIVFIAVIAVIVGGGVALYLRHRKPSSGPNDDPTSPSGS